MMGERGHAHHWAGVPTFGGIVTHVTSRLARLFTSRQKRLARVKITLASTSSQPKGSAFSEQRSNLPDGVRDN